MSWTRARGHRGDSGPAGDFSRPARAAPGRAGPEGASEHAGFCAGYLGPLGSCPEAQRDGRRDCWAKPRSPSAGDGPGCNGFRSTRSVARALRNKPSLFLFLGVPFPKNFMSVAKTILKRLFRVYAHIYHQHFDPVIQLQEEAHLNTSFKHFIFFVQVSVAESLQLHLDF